MESTPTPPATTPAANPIPPAPQPPVPTPSSAPKSNSFLAVLLVILLLGLLGVAGYFYYQNMLLKQQLTNPSPTPVPASPSPQASVPASASPSASPQAGKLETYTDPVNKFEIQYPPAYKITYDKYGWPKATLILYKGGQSYDLVIEVWSSAAEYQAKYANPLPGTLTVKESPGGKFFTLLNMNKDPKVDEIIATFKFL